MKSYKRSLATLEKAEKIIPLATQMLAKGYQQHSRGASPVYISHSKGAHVWDIDGNKFIDLTMGMGPISLGYCNEIVDEAIREQLTKGINYTLIDELEYKVAKNFVDLIPCFEMVRFGKTGADAVAGAVRLARAYTGKNKIICCGYHGWHDWYIGSTTRALGIPKIISELTYKVEYDNLDAIEKIVEDDRDISCIVIEPVVFKEPSADYLFKLRELCTAAGILLIFDEVWTGFRIALGGAQQYFSVTPDLACFSKACTNGMPFSVMGGKSEIMSLMKRDDFFFFTTYGGEMLSLAAVNATLEFMKTNPVIEHNTVFSARLRDAFNSICDDLKMKEVRSIGLDYRTMVNFSGPNEISLLRKTYLQQLLMEEGVLWTGFHHMSYSHNETDIIHVENAYRNTLPKLKDAIDSENIKEKLTGEILKPVFRNMGLGDH